MSELFPVCIEDVKKMSSFDIAGSDFSILEEMRITFYVGMARSLETLGIAKNLGYSDISELHGEAMKFLRLARFEAQIISVEQFDTWRKRLDAFMR